MTSTAALQPDPSPITACTVARDVQNFDLLIEDMETELGEGWGDLNFTDAGSYLSQPEASALEFIAIAVDNQDNEDDDILSTVGDLITRTKDMGIRAPIALHQLLKLGADDFVPYPLPEGALHDAIERIRNAAAAPALVDTDHAQAGTGGALRSGRPGDKQGVIMPVHGLAGGVGSSTFAVNLAWELATVDKKYTPKVCLLDLDFQFGSASTYLDLPRRDAVYEMLSDMENTDDEV